MYDLIDPLEDFFLNLKFIDLNLFKKELVDFLTWSYFGFKYINNDVVMVRAVCSGKT